MTAQYYIYRNLHKKCWSVRLRGLVVGHEDSVVMTNVHLKVNPAGRQRTLKENRKNVHAFAVSAIVRQGQWNVTTRDRDNYSVWEAWEQVKYNPWQAGHFYAVHDLRPVNWSPNVFLNDKGEMWAEKPTWWGYME